MNNKGQMVQVGAFLALFVGLIFALSLITGGISSSVGNVVNTISVVNESNTWGTTVVLSGQAATVTQVVNASNGFVIPASNYTVTNYDVSTGTLRTYITNASGYVPGGTAVKVSYTYEPLGYAKEAGTRAITNLVLVFASLAIVAFALWKLYNDGLFDFFG